MIYLYNPINNVKTPTDYELLEGITGKAIGNLMSLKSKKRMVGNIGCYIVDDNTPLQELRTFMQNVKINDEIWKTVENASNYEISNYGRIRKTYKSKTRILMPFIRHRTSDKGHKNKSLAIKIIDDNGKTKENYVHHLVARYFLENEDNLPCIYHKNENILDNYAGNLMYISREELARLTAHKSNGIPVLKLDAKTGEVLGEYENMAEAGRQNYLHRETIRQCVAGLQKTAGGFKWVIDDGRQYEEDVI